VTHANKTVPTTLASALNLNSVTYAPNSRKKKQPTSRK